MRRILLGILVLLFASSCQVKSVLIKPPGGEGKVAVYLRPIATEGVRLAFTLTGVYAVRQDGGDVPLSLRLSEISGATVPRERLLAAADLPPGPYAGLAFSVKRATLESGGEKADLRLPEAPVQVAFPFTVRGDKGLVLSLELRTAASVRQGFLFAPAFAVSIPGKLNSGLLGLATGRNSSTVTVFDKRTGHVTELIFPGAGPTGIVLDRLRWKAYVALSGDDAVAVLDLLSSEIRDRIRLQGGDAPADVAMTPDGSFLVTANSGSNTASILDTRSQFETARIRVGPGPRTVLIDSSGRRAYVFNARGSTVSVIDIPTRMPAGQVTIDPAPLQGQFNRAGKILYVIHETSPYLTVLDPLALQVQRRIHVGYGARALKVDTATDQFFLAARGAKGADVYDPVSLLPYGFVDAPGDVSYMTIDGEENNLILAIPGEKSLAAVGLIGFGPTWTADLVEGPYRVTVIGER